MFNRLLNRPFFIRLLHWEYWSFTMVYIWIYPIWIFLCLRARSFFFFAASNPAIRNGGFLNESKKEIYQISDPSLSPRTIFFSLPSNSDIVLLELRANGFDYPMIGKPDIGGRGRGISILRDDSDVRSYVSRACLDFHIQEFVPYKNEVGIFYHRLPGEATGRISGIVRKEFLSVRGDGVSTVESLMQLNKRAILQLDVLRTSGSIDLNEVPGEGEVRVIVPFGNHARGAEFLDDSHLIDAELTHTIDRVCRTVTDFYFGRLDIRYSDWDSLKKGKDFSVIEFNGAGSEPTHIYDPRHSLFFAWKEIVKHWIILWKISRANHKRGHRYLTFKEGVQMFREDKLISAKLEQMGGH
jgi:hypothetical protein